MKLPEGSIHINGEVTEYETSIDYPLGYRETTVTIRESAYELMHPQARCNPIFKEENEQLKKARDESDKFIAKKGLGAEFLNWCVAND